MKTVKNFGIILFLGSSLLFFGCAAHYSKPSGFLKNYGRIRPDKRFQGVYLEKNPRYNIRQFNAYQMLPVQVYFHAGLRGRAVDSSELQVLTDYFFKELKSDLRANYKIVDEPTENVLLIRAALTDVVPGKAALNTKAGVSAPDFNLKEGALEVEFLDSRTNDRVFAMIFTYKGTQLKQAPGLTTWGHSKDIMRIWAQQIKERLDEINGIS